MSREDEIRTNLKEVQKKSDKTCDNTSVGIIIRQGDKILLLERKKPPLGFAPPAGHVDGHGSFEQAAKDEVNEEVGFITTSLKLVAEGVKENYCRRKGGTWHNWKVYEAGITGDLNRSLDETKQAGWFSPDQIKSLTSRTNDYLSGKITEEEWQKSPGIEPVWLEWFKELGMAQ